MMPVLCILSLPALAAVVAAIIRRRRRSRSTRPLYLFQDGGQCLAYSYRIQALLAASKGTLPSAGMMPQWGQSNPKCKAALEELHNHLHTLAHPPKKGLSRRFLDCLLGWQFRLLAKRNKAAARK